MLTVKAEVDLSEPKRAYATAKDILYNTGDMEWSPHNLAHVNAVPNSETRFTRDAGACAWPKRHRTRLGPSPPTSTSSIHRCID